MYSEDLYWNFFLNQSTRADYEIVLTSPRPMQCKRSLSFPVGKRKLCIQWDWEPKAIGLEVLPNLVFPLKNIIHEKVCRSCRSKQTLKQFVKHANKYRNLNSWLADNWKRITTGAFRPMLPNTVWQSMAMGSVWLDNTCFHQSLWEKNLEKLRFPLLEVGNVNRTYCIIF